MTTAMTDSTPLERNMGFFRSKIEEWMVTSPGRVVLVHDAKLVGVYDSEADALVVAGQLFGVGPFLIRRVQREDEEFSAPALALGILSAVNQPPSPNIQG